MSLPDIAITGALSAVRDKQKADHDKQEARVTKATQDFEAIFIGMMLKQMRKSMAGENPLFGKSSESKLYQDMMDDKLAETMSRTGTFGLARAMKASIDRGLPSDPNAQPPSK
jgi:flagellar protein FlgJ